MIEGILLTLGSLWVIGKSLNWLINKYGWAFKGSTHS
nr:MAG TPA: hypothetical protein [Caudoviricetes sp.]